MSLFPVTNQERPYEQLLHYSDGEQIFFQVKTLYTHNLFCLQKCYYNQPKATHFVRNSKTQSKLKHQFETKVFSLPRQNFIVQSTQFSGGATPATQFMQMILGKYFVVSYSFSGFENQICVFISTESTVLVLSGYSFVALEVKVQNYNKTFNARSLGKLTVSLGT